MLPQMAVPGMREPQPIIQGNGHGISGMPLTTTWGKAWACTHHDAAKLFGHQKGHEPVGEDTDAGSYPLDMQREDL